MKVVSGSTDSLVSCESINVTSGAVMLSRTENFLRMLLTDHEYQGHQAGQGVRVNLAQWKSMVGVRLVLG